jgi:hypothetical protein
MKKIANLQIFLVKKVRGSGFGTIIPDPDPTCPSSSGSALSRSTTLPSRTILDQCRLGTFVNLLISLPIFTYQIYWNSQKVSKHILRTHTQILHHR